MFYDTEKDRSSMGVDDPVQTKKQIQDGESLGYGESNHIDYRRQYYAAYRAGYDYAYGVFMPRILDLEDQLRYFIKNSVAQMFHEIGYDGAASARERSAHRFRTWYESHRQRDAA